MMKRIVRLQVKLDPNTLVIEEGIPTPIGYYQLLGCTARDEEDLESQVRMHVAEDLGGTIIEVEDYGEPDFGQLVDNIREAISADPEEWGIWYLSGRAMYSKDDVAS